MGHWTTKKDQGLMYQINKRTSVSWYNLTVEVLKAMLAEKVITNLDYLCAMRDVKK